MKYQDLKIIEKAVNELLDNIQLRVTRRYNYIAIDIYDKQGERIRDTLIAGLTKGEAAEFLHAVRRILLMEKD
ncbi:MAG: hypothetical protein QXO44_03240 [Thermoplasmatales archaeon]